MMDATSTLTCSGTKTWKEEFELVSQTAAENGFPYLIYAPVRAHVQAAQNWTCTTYPKIWQEIYVAKNYLPRNPVRQHTLRSRKPFLWSELEHFLTSADREIFHDCRASGMEDGIVFPIHGPNGQAVSVGFACDDRKAITPEVMPVLHWMAFRLYHAQDDISAQPEIRLTAREKELVLLLIEGRDNVRIADALHLSDNSVEWHLKNIYRKLEVRNRTSAAIKAYKLGLVHD